ncbi:DUF551 domain-containing protein [Paenibacillus sp. IITD108]|uniref:DUF551 domain-containing protein n=1 Tax=Paenibacillus sp. IITD108 TaxID=3116649 RepID=UPI002F3FE759
MNEWIKITEKMPQHNEAVLLYFDDGEIANGYLKIYDGVLSETIKGGIVCKYKEATHWMPLPEPPVSKHENKAGEE